MERSGNRRRARREPRAGERSLCPIATTLDIIGDKWSMVVLRDLFVGARQYGDFLKSPEKIPTNILADRLNRLVAAGMVEKKPYQDRPVRYEYKLTKKGLRFLPVLQEICRWANRFYPESWKPPESFMKRRVRN